MRDFLSNIQLKRAISPAAAGTDNTAFVSQIIDRLGYESLTFAIATGGLTDVDATFTTLIEESDDSGLSGSNAVADADMVSQTLGTAPETAASFTFAADDNVRSIGYIGTKRYVRMTITPSGNNSGNIYIAAMAILGNPTMRPVTHATA